MEKTIIFDMDGVIFDTERLFLKCWEKLGEKYGIPSIREVVFECIGTNNERTKEIIYNRYGADFAYESYREEVNASFATYLKQEGMPVKLGVTELLDMLKKEEYQIGLASSTRRERVVEELSMAGLIQYFDVVIGGDMVNKSKPDPEIFLLCANKMNAKPKETYVIEDSYNGILAAHAGGMKPIMVPDLLPATEQMKELSIAILPDLFAVKDMIFGK